MPTQAPCGFAAIALATLTATAGVSGQSFPGANWPLATPESQGLDGTVLAQGIGALPWPANSGPLIVIANGFEVLRVGDVTRQEYIYSCSKLVTAMVCAGLHQQGRISSLDSLVPSTYHTGAWGGYPGDSTYRQFLTMTSDYGLSPYHPAGGQYAYNNYAFDFLGESMSRQFFNIGPDRMADVVNQALGTTLGFQDSLSFAGQWGGWGGGLRMSARDFARLGYLLLRDGVWQGQRLLSQEFVNGLYRSQIPATAQRYQGSSATQSDPFNQQSATDLLGGSWSFGLWRVGPTAANGTWTFAAGDGYRGKRLILCPRGSLPNPGLEVLIACVPQLPNEGPPTIDYVDVVIQAARAALPVVPDTPGCVTASFESGGIEPFEARLGTPAVSAGRLNLQGPTRALMPGTTYDGCDVLLNIAPGFPLDSHVGVVLRASAPSDDAWLTTGAQTLVRLWRDAAGAFRVQVTHHQGGQRITHTSAGLTNARADRSIEMLVCTRGDTVWCSVDGEQALGVRGYSGIPTPSGGGWLSIRSGTSQGSIGLDHVLIRPANGPRAFITVNGAGDQEISLLEPYLLGQLDAQSLALVIDQVTISANNLPLVQPWLWPSLPSAGQHHLTLSSRAAAVNLPSGTRLGIVYRGQLDGAVVP